MLDHPSRTNEPETLAFLLALVETKQILVNRLERSLAQKGQSSLTLRQWLTLALIQEGKSLKELAQLRGVSKQAMSQICEGLAQAAYIHLKPDHQDARVLQITMTTRGRKAVKDGFEQIEQIRKQLAETIPESIFNCLLLVLKAIHESKQEQTNYSCG